MTRRLLILAIWAIGPERLAAHKNGALAAVLFGCTESRPLMVTKGLAEHIVAFTVTTDGTSAHLVDSLVDALGSLKAAGGQRPIFAFNGPDPDRDVIMAIEMGAEHAATDEATESALRLRGRLPR